MCWIAVAALAITAVSAYASNRNQKKAAQKQDQAIEAQRAADAEALVYQKDELNRSVDENISFRAREAMVERGRITAAMAESGLGGGGVERLTRQSRFNEGFDITTMNENRERQLRQMEAENKAAGARASSRSASIVRPSTLGTALQIGGGALDFARQLPPGTFSSSGSAASQSSPTSSPQLVGE